MTENPILDYESKPPDDPRQSQWGRVSIWCSSIAIILVIIGIYCGILLVRGPVPLCVVIPACGSVLLLVILGAITGLIGVLQTRKRRGTAIVGLVLATMLLSGIVVLVFA